MPKIHKKSKSVCKAAHTRRSSGKSVRVRDFLTCFRQRPDDLYLMQKFSFSPKQLAKAYQALIETGLLTELEYHYLRGIPPIASESRTVAPDHREATTKNRNSEIRGVGPQRDEIREPLMYLREPVWWFAVEVLSQRSDGPDRELRKRLPVDKSARCGSP